MMPPLILPEKPHLPTLACDVIVLDNWAAFGRTPAEGPAMGIIFHPGSEKDFSCIQDEMKYQFGAYHYQTEWKLPFVLTTGSYVGRVSKR